MSIEASVVIARPINEVFAFVGDPLNDPLWCPKVQSVKQIEGDGPGPGARYRVAHRPVPLLPVREMRYELTVWEPPGLIGWHEDDGHDRIAVTYVLETEGAHTRFTQIDHADLGAPRFLHPVVRAGIRHDVAAQLRRLRRHLQQRPLYARDPDLRDERTSPRSTHSYQRRVPRGASHRVGCPVIAAMRS